MRSKLLELYRKLYKATSDITIGCGSYGCGRLCEEGPDAFDLLKPGECWVPWEFYLLPWEHELLAEVAEEKETRFSVVNIGGMPIATVKFDDYCPYYTLGAGLCQIFDERPMICRSYPLWPHINLTKRSVSFSQIDFCPAKLAPEFISRYTDIYNQLIPEVSETYWRFHNVLGEGSLVPLSTKHTSDWYTRFKNRKKK